VNQLLRDVLPALALDERFTHDHLALGEGNALPSALAVNTLACGSVAAAGLAGLALRGGEQVLVDPLQVAVSFRGDQVMRVSGQPVPGFAPLSGFVQARDGWVRTHANYPHHRLRLTGALGLADDAGPHDLAAAVGGMPAQDVEDRVTAAGGIAVRVREHREWRHSEQAAAVAAHPLLSVERGSGGPPRPVPARPRVLDLTRVIAGPVATRTLALLGCDVLRVDSPHLPELETQHLDTGSGKRSTLLDLHDAHAREQLHALLDGADVLVTGYRPGSLERFGLGPEALAARHPALVQARLSAWSPSGPWGSRRGFDSIVQAATGIALVETDRGGRPGALPAQALDHATGYLLGAGVLTALRHRAEEGGGWQVAAHLARTAHWLLDTSALDAPAALPERLDPWTMTADTDDGEVTLARPALRIDGGPTAYRWVGRRWGSDPAAWAGGRA
jgi:hypothetical protein